MSDFAIIGDTITLKIPLFKELMIASGKAGGLQGALEYKASVDRETYISTEDVAQRLRCTAKTIGKYIREGHKTAGKLPAIKKGERHYLVNVYDLNLFIEKMKA